MVTRPPTPFLRLRSAETATALVRHAERDSQSYNPGVDPVFFATPDDMREWLEANHERQSGALVGFYKKDSGTPSITWPESVDEALCFGWIDGVRKNRDGSSYTIRFTPRKPRSFWSQVNIKRAEELIAQGRMRPAGLAAFEARVEDRSRVYSYEQGGPQLGEPFAARFRANPKAWDFFRSQAPSYQRACSWWVVSAKREETRDRRLAQLIEYSERGLRIPAFVSPTQRK
jgi:uncharacterized protein YdeI (YjbR/CyaY-like superfamily)